MADEAVAEGVIEDWTEPIDLSILGDDGPTTIFVGGFSSIKTAADALLEVRYREDNVVFLDGTYDEDLCVDGTYLNGVNLRGQGNVVFTGKLAVQYSSFNPARVLRVPPVPEGEESAPPPIEGEDAPPPEEEEDGGEAKKEPPRPPRVTIGNMSFLSGLLAEGLSCAYVDDCTFGTPIGVPPLDHCAVTHALSTVLCSRCKFYGSGKAVLYAFPKSRAAFQDCQFAGAVKPVTNTEPVRRKRGYVPPPPPPPTAPTSTECQVGVYLDDAEVTISRSTISHVGIGILCRDACRGSTIEDSVVSLTSATGILLTEGSAPKIARTNVSLTGREALLVSNESHPIIRKCNFVGDVRLKTRAIHTGLTDNVVGLSHQVIQDGNNFEIKGFVVVPTDPTYVKPKKQAPADEDA